MSVHIIMRNSIAAGNLILQCCIRCLECVAKINIAIFVNPSVLPNFKRMRVNSVGRACKVDQHTLPTVLSGIRNHNPQVINDRAGRTPDKRISQNDRH